MSSSATKVGQPQRLKCARNVFRICVASILVAKLRFMAKVVRLPAND